MSFFKEYATKEDCAAGQGSHDFYIKQGNLIYSSEVTTIKADSDREIGIANLYFTPLPCGSTYIVYFNGKKYNCKSEKFLVPTISEIGNLALYYKLIFGYSDELIEYSFSAYGYSLTEEPFLILFDEEAQALITETAGTYLIEIYEGEVAFISDPLLPDDLVRKSETFGSPNMIAVAHQEVGYDPKKSYDTFVTTDSEVKYVKLEDTYIDSYPDPEMIKGHYLHFVLGEGTNSYITAPIIDESIVEIENSNSFKILELAQQIPFILVIKEDSIEIDGATFTEGVWVVALPFRMTSYNTIKEEIIPNSIARVSDIEAALAQAKASGEFDGEPGETGADGFSPTVEVAEITGGHRVTITDATGAHIFDVMDGEGGAGGDAGSGLPSVTTADNGKFLQVVNGAWAAVALADVSEEGM